MTCLPWHEPLLRQLLATGRALPHALLMYGAQGIGKLAFARALVQALLCEALAPDGPACGACAGCGWFAAGTHPDWLALEPEEGEGEGEQASEKKGSRQITIAQVRMLADFVNLSGHRGGPKVVLVHPAEALNISAANALLKNLEEPPPNTYFILVTHRPRFILPTIKSRCRQLPMRQPSREDALAWLEREKVAHAALALAQTGNAPLLAARLDDSEWWTQRRALLDGIADPGFDALAVAERVRDIPVASLVPWLQKWSYDMILSRFLGRVRYNPDYADAVAASAKAADIRGLQRFHRHLVGLQRIVHHPLNARLMIEDLLLAYARQVQPD